MDQAEEPILVFRAAPRDLVHEYALGTPDGRWGLQKLDGRRLAIREGEPHQIIEADQGRIVVTML
jgi:hypothetical protein